MKQTVVASFGQTNPYNLSGVNTDAGRQTNEQLTTYGLWQARVTHNGTINKLIRLDRKAPISGLSAVQDTPGHFH